MNSTLLTLGGSAITVQPSCTRSVSQPISVRFERDHGLPSNTRQQPSLMEAQSTAAEVLKPKDTDRSSSDGDDATPQPGPDNVIDQTDDVLRLVFLSKHS